MTDHRLPKVDSVAADTFPNPASEPVSYPFCVNGAGFETRPEVLAEPVSVTAGGDGVSISKVEVYNSERIDCTLTISPGYHPGPKSVTVSQKYPGGTDKKSRPVTKSDTLNDAFSVL